MYQSNSKDARWMMDLGQIPIPKSWFAQREIKIESEDGRKRIFHCKRLDSKQMLKKLRRGIIALLKNKYVETRDETYQILKERNFLPVIAGYKIMSYPRFYHYYAETRISIGFKRHRETKMDFIKDHYKTWSVDSLANHIGSKKIYVQQTISKIKRGLIK